MTVINLAPISDCKLCFRVAVHVSVPDPNVKGPTHPRIPLAPESWYSRELPTSTKPCGKPGRDPTSCDHKSISSQEGIRESIDGWPFSSEVDLDLDLEPNLDLEPLESHVDAHPEAQSGLLRERGRTHAAESRKA
ncbi:hypothetical protein JHW43_003153 [Diplocarpon mali]|nr:hypothetical protein JHW43_003153 [Diplocarpon mali]